MTDKQVITDDMLEPAVLDGVPCRACAWVEVTYFEVPVSGRNETQLIEGLRTWRGKAVVEHEGFLEGTPYFDRAIRYAGRVKDGEGRRDVQADVYVREARRVRPPSRGPGQTRVYVEFVGAGRLPAT